MLQGPSACKIIPEAMSTNSVISPLREGAAPLGFVPLVSQGSFDSSQCNNSAEDKTKEGTAVFGGELTIEGLPPSRQQFSERWTNGIRILESLGQGSNPYITLELESDQQRFRCNVQPSEDSADAWILSTRLSYLIETGRPFGIRSEGAFVTPLLKADVSPDDQLENIAYFGKLCRKLSFLETIFKWRFPFPNIWPNTTLRNLELAFRGVTEGEFPIRGQWLTIQGVTLSDLDLSKPPFTGPGSFQYKKKDPIELLGRTLDLGPITIILESAQIATHRVLNDIVSNPEKPMDLRLFVYDNRVVYRFERYIGRSKKSMMQGLARFKKLLAAQEPEELVALTDESLQVDISADEATDVATAWLQHFDFPDRYCSQQPVLDSGHARWTVPVFLAAAAGRGVSVGDITIDARTGVIVGHTPIDEMRSRGAAVAETLLDAR